MDFVDSVRRMPSRRWVSALSAALVFTFLFSGVQPLAAKASKKSSSKRLSSGNKGQAYYTKYNINRPLSVTQALFTTLGFDSLLGSYGSDVSIDALEVGCGEGRTILELQAALPNSQVCMWKVVSLMKCRYSHHTLSEWEQSQPWAVALGVLNLARNCICLTVVPGSMHMHLLVATLTKAIKLFCLVRFTA